ncbi:hypothetical protein CDAR_271431 [Caerostris darwini]|uniref:Uncharacterized protein n=1 Tax=Caerostris darwini TaxID=1538125 RepID=A0AAV4T3A1_9ARAC|nr:hypothetical protein CDAR_271431 [Caerostris darwini]
MGLARVRLDKVGGDMTPESNILDRHQCGKAVPVPPAVPFSSAETWIEDLPSALEDSSVPPIYQIPPLWRPMPWSQRNFF